MRPALVASCLLLLGFTLPALAAPGDQELVYDLRVGDQSVGTRTVSIRFLDGADAAGVEVIESYTQIDTTLMGTPLHFENRASAQLDAGTSSFVSSVDENGHLREIQARQRRDGVWKVTVIEDKAVKQADLPRGQVDLSTLQLLDLQAARDLTARARASVLLAETGTVMSGQVDDLGEGTVDVAGQSLPVHRWAWSPALGRMELAWSMDGVLVSYQAPWMGRTLQAKLRSVPAPRSWGQVEPVSAATGGMSEQEL